MLCWELTPWGLIQCRVHTKVYSTTSLLGKIWLILDWNNILELITSAWTTRGYVGHILVRSWYIITLARFRHYQANWEPHIIIWADWLAHRVYSNCWYNQQHQIKAVEKRAAPLWSYLRSLPYVASLPVLQPHYQYPLVLFQVMLTPDKHTH